MIDAVMSELIGMAYEMNNERNDGYSKEYYRKKLEEYRAYLNKILENK